MKVIELISNAYDWGKIFPNRGIPPGPSEIERAERYLRSIIRTINIDGGEIALNSQLTINMQAGDDTVALDGYIEIVKAQYILGNVRLDIDILSIDNFYSNASVVNATSVPYCAYPKRRGGGIDFIVYFTPNQNYVLEINGIKSLDYLTQDDDITPELEFYEDLLTWELAKRLRQFKGLDYDPNISAEIARVKRKLRSIKPNNSSMGLSYIGSGPSDKSLRKLATSGQEGLLGGWRP